LTQNLLWLLLPVAAASGWWSALRYTRKQSHTPISHQSPAYFRGLNHLLNEEPDKAIDVFIEMLEVDNETVETHLALGSLFRQRGEVERAIRIHQNLIARPALAREEREQAMLELGKDYMRAGLYDRAENLFKELQDGHLHVVHALRHLRTIYQQEKEWAACLETAEKLEKQTGENLSLEKSHYYCELAQNEHKTSQAKRYLKRALGVHQGCVRALHMLAEQAILQNDMCEAARLLRNAVEQEPDYLPEVMPQLLESHKALGDLSQLRLLLESIAKQYPQRGAELYLAELMHQQEGEDAAVDYLSGYIQRTPSIQGLARLLELQTQRHHLGEGDLLYSVFKHLQQLLAERVNYQCHKCGFHANTLHWQCPSCKRWSSIKPKPLLETPA
jgi:lipopolysaccharide biosynthesis regulator YciM